MDFKQFIKSLSDYELGRLIVAIILIDQMKSLKRFGVKFDNIAFESDFGGTNLEES